jgi:hypothetical protein
MIPVSKMDSDQINPAFSIAEFLYISSCYSIAADLVTFHTKITSIAEKALQALSNEPTAHDLAIITEFADWAPSKVKFSMNQPQNLDPLSPQHRQTITSHFLLCKNKLLNLQTQLDIASKNVGH